MLHDKLKVFVSCIRRLRQLTNKYAVGFSQETEMVTGSFLAIQFPPVTLSYTTINDELAPRMPFLMNIFYYLYYLQL